MTGTDAYYPKSRSEITILRVSGPRNIDFASNFWFEVRAVRALLGPELGRPQSPRSHDHQTGGMKWRSVRLIYPGP